MPGWILERQRARAAIKYPWYLIWKSINANCTLLQRSSMTSAKCVWSPGVRFAFSLRYPYLIASALPRLVISVTRVRQYLNKLTQMHLSIPPPDNQSTRRAFILSNYMARLFRSSDFRNALRFDELVVVQPEISVFSFTSDPAKLIERNRGNVRLAARHTRYARHVFFKLWMHSKVCAPPDQLAIS